MFGARSEKACAEQYELALEDIEAAQEAVHAEDEADDRQVSGTPRPRKANRGALPKHLPRIEEVIEPNALQPNLLPLSARVFRIFSVWRAGVAV